MDPTWYIYLGVFLSPFVQEDAAVIAAATLSASNPDKFPTFFCVIIAGLFLSDIWKYWIGYSAHASARARRWAEKDKVMAMSERVQRHAVTTLLTARFIPLARVPAYIACGYFKMHYLKFCAIIFGTAVLYACVAIFIIVAVFGIGGLLKAQKKSD